MKWKYPVFTAVLVMMLVFTQIPSKAASAYADMKGHWAEGYVDALAQKGIISGFPDGKFHPENIMTLAQFTKIIISATSGSKQITQASGTQWPDVYMEEALQSGLIDNVVYKDRSAWDKPVNRLEMARIVHSTLLNVMKESDEEDVGFVKNDLTDLDSCRTCLPHIEQCYAKGIINGFSNRTFGGNEYMTRAEGSTVAARMIDKTLRKIPKRVEKADGYKKITPADAKMKREKVPGTVFVDVRRPDEFSTGYISGSINLPYGTATQADYEAALPDKSTCIIVYCASGIRSAKAAALLGSWGYVNVYDMSKVTAYPDPLVKAIK